MDEHDVDDFVCTSLGVHNHDGRLRHFPQNYTGPQLI